MLHPLHRGRNQTRPGFLDHVSRCSFPDLRFLVVLPRAFGVHGTSQTQFTWICLSRWHSQEV